MSKEEKHHGPLIQTVLRGSRVQLSVWLANGRRGVGGTIVKRRHVENSDAEKGK